MMLSSLFLNSEPKNILMIGLGVGSITSALNYLSPETNIDIVELHPEIVKSTNRLFNIGFNCEKLQYEICNNKNNIFIQDGVEYVEQHKSDKKYDIIFMDAFNKNYIPSGFLTDEFMENAKNILSDNGVFVMNTHSSRKRNETKLFEDHYGNYITLEDQRISNNKVIIGYKGKLDDLGTIYQNSLKFYKQFGELSIDIQRIISLMKRF